MSQSHDCRSQSRHSRSATSDTMILTLVTLGLPFLVSQSKALFAVRCWMQVSVMLLMLAVTRLCHDLHTSAQVVSRCLGLMKWSSSATTSGGSSGSAGGRGVCMLSRGSSKQRSKRKGSGQVCKRECGWWHEQQGSGRWYHSTHFRSQRSSDAVFAVAAVW